jgi:hypothetical protein
MSPCVQTSHREGDGTCGDFHLAVHVEPDKALAAVTSHAGPVIVDFDETLYLRNSTEDFLDCAVPGLFGRLILKALWLLAPWRITGRPTRDAWRVRIIALLFPWIWLRWKARVKALATGEVNARLCSAVARRDDVIVATLGFEPVVRPLLDAMGLAHVKLVACRFGSFADRRMGKLSLLQSQVGRDAVARSLVVTDSQEDIPLLAACAVPLFVVWPQARIVPALSRVYLPFEYLSKVKRPKKRYFVSAVLGDDYVMWILASIALAGAVIPHLVGLLLLLLSFWAIYERGYVDNDLVAARYEKDPVLSDAFYGSHVATPRLAPWIWAMAFGLGGVAVLAWPEPPSGGALASWSAILVGTHFVFHAYNRLDKSARVWMFTALQVLRAFAFVAVVPVTAIGAVGLSALALSRWVGYFVYRAKMSTQWRNLPVHIVRLMLFLVMGFALLIGTGAETVEWWTSAALLLWFLSRAVKDVYATVRSTHTVYAEEDRRGKGGGVVGSVDASTSDAVPTRAKGMS